MTIDPTARRTAVRRLSLDALKADPGNARLHSDRQVARIADRIAAFGFNVPALLDEDGRIPAGRGRLLAARRHQGRQGHEDEGIARPGAAWRLGSHHLAVSDEGAGGPR